jgi:protein TonB
MLTELLESNPRKDPLRRAVPSAMMSVAVHTAVICGAVAVTMRPPTPPVPVPLDTIAVLPEFPQQQRPRAPASAPDVPGALAQPTFVIPPVEVPTGIPPVELLPASVPAKPWPVRRQLSWGDPGDTAGVGTRGVYRELVVDEAPRRISSPPVRYPRLLEQGGINGLVLVEVVIDTTGHPEPSSFRVLDTSHPAFVGAARELVQGSLYRPGRVAGRPVRVLVQLPIAFQVRRDR